MEATGPVTGGILMVQRTAVFVLFVVRVEIWGWEWDENRKNERKTKTDGWVPWF